MHHPNYRHEDPILQLGKELQEAELQPSRRLEELKSIRSVIQGIFELSKNHSFQALIEKLEKSEKLAINRMVTQSSGSDFHFNRGWVFGLRAALGIIRDSEKTLQAVDSQISTLKNQIGSSRPTQEKSR